MVLMPAVPENNILWAATVVRVQVAWRSDALNARLGALQRLPPFRGPIPLVRRGYLGQSGRNLRARGRGLDMYIGVGTLVVILIIVLIIYFIRRA